jgi:hypothetical protein
MRQTRLLFALACCFIATAAFAQTAVTASPHSFFQFAPEEEVVFTGTNIAGADHTIVVFSGPGGTFAAEGGALGANTVVMSVPPAVTQTVGTWSVEVEAFDTAAGAPRLNFGSITIVAIPQTNPPILGLPEAVSAEATDASGAHVSFDVGAINDDGSPVAVTCNHNSGDLFPLNATKVSCSATNSFGTSTGSFTVFVGDTVGPVLTLPDDIVSATAVVTYTATAADAIDGALPVICSPASGSTFPNGTTTVRCVATDAHANQAVGTFHVSFGNAPTLTLPADILAEATSAAGAVVTYSATADQNATVVCTPPSGSTFALGTTTVNCTATNAVNESATGSFDVTVVDTTPPSITVPADITAEATSASGATVSYTVSATDAVDGTVGVVCSPASGTTFALGSTTVSCTATDAHNNTSTKSFAVNVVDTTPPVITSLTVTPTVIWPPNHTMIPITVTATAVDAVDPNPLVHIISIESNQPVDAVDAGDGVTSPDWEITGPLTAKVRAERTSGVDRIYTITIQAVDFSNNSTWSTVQVKVSQQSSSKSHAAH